MSGASLLNIINILQLLIAGGCALTGIKFLFTGLFRRYPTLFAYLFFHAIYSAAIVLWFGNPSSNGYLKFWVLTEPLIWIFYVVMVLELYSLVLERFRGLSTLGRWFLYAGVAVSILISGLALLPHIEMGRAQRSVIMGYYLAIERGVDFSLLIFLIFLLIWLTRYPVPLSRNVVVHSIVYSAVFLSNTLGYFTRVIFGTDLSLAASTFMLGVFATCIFIWLFFMTSKGEEVQVSIPHFGPEHEERILNQLDALNATLLKVSRR